MIVIIAWVREYLHERHGLLVLLSSQTFEWSAPMGNFVQRDLPLMVLLCLYIIAHKYKMGKNVLDFSSQVSSSGE